MKKIKLIAFLLAIVSVGLSCKEENPMCGCGPGPESTAVKISFKNSAGKDLLDPANNAIVRADVDLLVLQKNGLVSKQQLLSIKQGLTDYYLLAIFDNKPESFNGNRETMYIKHYSGTQDEIVGEFTTDNNRKRLTSIWVNGTKEWDAATNTSIPIVELVK